MPDTPAGPLFPVVFDEHAIAEDLPTIRQSPATHSNCSAASWTATAVSP